MNAFLRSYTMILFLPLFLCSAQSIVFQQYAGPFSAGITPFCQLPDGSVCIGSEREGVLRSSDDGRNWSRENDGLPGNNVVSLCIDPASRILYAALRGGGIYRFDGVLRRWERSGEAPMAYPTIMLSQNGSMYALDSAHTVLRSSDGGGSWQAAFVPAEHGISDVLCGAVHGEAVILGTQLAGVFTSLDQGATWTNSYTRIPPVRAVFYSSSGIAFASNTKETIRSTDKGASWSVVPTGPAGITSFTEDESGVLWAASSGAYYSTDSGATWWARTGAGGATRVIGTRARSVLWAQQYRGLSRIADTASTSVYSSFDFPNVPSNNAVPDLVGTPAGTLLASQLSSTFRSTDGGVGWTRVSFGARGEAGALQLATDTIGHVYARLGDGSAWRSNNDGMDWQHFAPDSIAAKSIQQLFVRPNGDLFLATGDQQLWLSSDTGTTWRATRTNGVVRALCIPRDRVVIIGTDYATYRSEDGAATFVPNSAERLTAFDVNADGSVINAASRLSLLRSTDGGLTWQSRYTSPHGGYLTITAFMRTSDHPLLAGGSGLWLSEDDGLTWSLQGSLRLNAWTFLPNGDILAGTGTFGLMVGHWQTSTRVPSVGEKPLPALTLSAAWPNPSTSTSSVTVSLQRTASLRCDVYALLGERVATLCDEIRGEGVHMLTWDGRNEEGTALPSGTYIMSVHAGDAVATRTLVWLRR